MTTCKWGHRDYLGSHHEYCDFLGCPGDSLCNLSDYISLTNLVVTGCTDLTMPSLVKFTTFSFQYVAPLHWNKNVVILTKFLSLAAQKVVTLSEWWHFRFSVYHNELSYLCISPHYLIKLYDRHCFPLSSQWNTTNSLYIFHYPTPLYGPICIT